MREAQALLVYLKLLDSPSYRDFADFFFAKRVEGARGKICFDVFCLPDFTFTVYPQDLA